MMDDPARIPVLNHAQLAAPVEGYLFESQTGEQRSSENLVAPTERIIRALLSDCGVGPRGWGLRSALPIICPLGM